MNIDQLKIFLTVANTSNFSVSANKLNMSQSTVSKQIKELENYLDCRLFQRTTRSVSLTPEGKYFFGIAKNIVHSMDIARLNLKKNGKEFTLGYLNTYADKIFMPQLIKAIHKKFPTWDIHVKEVFLDDILNGLIHGNTSIVFGEEDCFEGEKHVKFYPLTKSNYYLITSSKSFVRNYKSIKISDLKNVPLILGNIRNYLQTEQHLHDKIIDEIGRSNIEYADDMMIMTLFIKAENKCGILPEYGIDKTDKSLNYIPIESDIYTTFGFGYLDTLPLSINLDTVTNLIKQVYKNYLQVCY